MEQESFFGSVRRFFRDYVDGLSGTSNFGKVVQHAAKDAAFRDKLLAAPGAVMAEAGVKLPEGMQVEVFANTDKVIHIVLPPFVSPETAGART
jgi:hypothetical protein